MQEAGQQALSHLKRYLSAELFELYYHMVQAAGAKPLNEVQPRGTYILRMRRLCWELRTPRSTVYRRLNTLIEHGLIAWLEKGHRARICILAMAQPEPPIMAESVGRPALAPRAFYPDDSEAMRLAKTLFQYVSLRLPSFKAPNLHVWAYEMDLLMRDDNHDFQEVDSVLRYSQRDPFWQGVTLSPSALRKHFNKLLLRMQNGNLNTDKTHPASRTSTREDQLKYLLTKYT